MSPRNIETIIQLFDLEINFRQDLTKHLFLSDRHYSEALVSFYINTRPPNISNSYVVSYDKLKHSMPLRGLDSPIHIFRRYSLDATKDEAYVKHIMKYSTNQTQMNNFCIYDQEHNKVYSLAFKKYLINSNEIIYYRNLRGKFIPYDPTVRLSGQRQLYIKTLNGYYELIPEVYARSAELGLSHDLRINVIGLKFIHSIFVEGEAIVDGEEVTADNIDRLTQDLNTVIPPVTRRTMMDNRFRKKD